MEGETPLMQIPGPTLQRLMCTTPLRQFLLMCMQLVSCASTSQYMQCDEVEGGGNLQGSVLPALTSAPLSGNDDPMSG